MPLSRLAAISAQTLALGSLLGCAPAPRSKPAPPAPCRGEACADAALRFEIGDGVPRDDAIAAFLYARACEGKVARACARLGAAHLEGRGVARDEVRALELLDSACKAGVAGACFDLARLFEDPSPTLPLRLGTASVEEAMARSYQQACDGGDARACLRLGELHASGTRLPLLATVAAKLFDKACEQGLGAACAHLGRAYAEGAGVARDEMRAAALYQKACAMNDAEGCAYLGAVTRDGTSVRKDEVRALAWFERACGGGHVGACFELGRAYAGSWGAIRDDVRSAALFRRACDADFLDGCVGLGRAYASGRGVGRSDDGAAALFGKACDGGDGIACRSAGRWARSSSTAPLAPWTLDAKERLSIARSLCPSTPVATATRITCQCPEFTEHGRFGRGMTLLRLGPFVAGSFSGPGREEVLVQAEGCMSGGNPGQPYGAPVLVRRTAEGWLRVFYEDKELGRCTPFVSARGRTRLLCHRERGQEGIHPVAFSVYWLDERRGQVFGAEETFFTYLEVDLSLVHRRERPGILPVVRTLYFKVRGAEAFTRGDDAAFSVEFSIRSRVDCAVDCPHLDRGAFTASLRYVFEGDGFLLEEASRKDFERLLPRLELPLD